MSSKEYYINRLRITGKLNTDTPSCVVTEILRAHNICIAKPINSVEDLLKDIKKIESYRSLNLVEPLSPRDLRLLATYVNIDYNTWTKSSLIKSYEHMNNFDKNNINDITYGQKTYDNVEVYNSCMLYNLCIKYNIKTDWKTKPEEMLLMIKQLNTSLSILKEQLISCISTLDKGSIINLLHRTLELNKTEVKDLQEETKETPKSKLPPLINLEVKDLTQSLAKYKSSEYILQQINPKSHYDAIILASLVYNLNLTESINPFAEYMRLKECKNINLYTPVDLDFRKKYLINKEWYNLTIYWEPKLSFIYDENSLKKLCTYEGFDHEDFRQYGFDSLLQISRISFNAFLGKNVYSNEEYTPINLIDIKDLHHNECLTMGNIETKDLKTYTFDELAEQFLYSKNFSNPMKPSENLEKRMIRKISLYANKFNHTKMINAIDEVEKWKSYSTEYTDRLRNIYEKNTKIKEMFIEILHCGMYMRGWKVVSDKYPLSEQNTKYENNDKTPDNIQSSIEYNVTESIQNVMSKLNEYSSEEKKILNSLPLIKISVNKEGFDYIVTPDPEDGLNIFDRLNIVLKGDKYKSTKSCIRVSSNIILVSVHYYMCALSLREPFIITSLDHIS